MNGWLDRLSLAVASENSNVFVPSRSANPRLVKIHRNYTIGEAAELLNVHKNTIRAWIDSGLATIDKRRPCLILGSSLADFLTRRRRSRKRPCTDGQIYCVRCRTPRHPAGDVADYNPITPTSGNLVGICPGCEGLIYRRVNLANLALVRGQLDVNLPEAQGRIDEDIDPSVNRDFKRL